MPEAKPLRIQSVADSHFMTVSVVIVTLNRPDCVRRCLDCLQSQQPRPDQVIVVDASPDTRTRDLIANQYPGTVYLRNEIGYGHMTMSRNIGLMSATGEVIAFIDDDAFARPGWVANLLAAYIEPEIGAVGGRAMNNVPGEETAGVNDVGRMRANGTLSANFAADTGEIREVDHMIGCNMSYRREVLAKLGGFREDCLGTEVGEETDMCLRVRQLGYRLVFTPLAVVDHLGAPQARGRRFDVRYDYYHRRNNLVVRLRNFGPGAMLLKYLAAESIYTLKEFFRKFVGAFARLGVAIVGTIVGLTVGFWLLIRNGKDPIRRDEVGRKIAAALGAPLSEQPAKAQSPEQPAIGKVVTTSA
jgi:GT2 family glycosyltransferase